MESNDSNLFYTANLILIDTDTRNTNDDKLSSNLIVIRIIFDHVDEHITLATLETPIPVKSESLSKILKFSIVLY